MAFSPTSSIQRSFKYDVFLSFRGEDTRKSFIDHLYDALKRKGIRTYKDDESINKGKRMSDELMRSIEDSKFYIIVFSKNYASSSWCLDELVKIMECQKMDEHAAYPVFFDVEPSEIRKQTGSVKRAFAKYRKENYAGKWRDALTEAADLAGWEMKNATNGHEAKFIQLIVENISLDLRCSASSIDGKLVGMEARVKDVVSYLKTSIDDVRIIGIKGMGGAGKTTLARAVYDQISIQFEGSSFVENVREVCNGSSKGLKSLQEQVLFDVLNDRSISISGVFDGKIQLKKVLCARKVLVVLDDVDHLEQLRALAGERNWFKTGSRIIITTRDEQVLVAHRVNFISDVNLLSREEAICLFSRYAFGTEMPIQGYKQLSEKVVDYASGLPLTISVLGSFLCGKSDVVWMDALERLETIPLKETLEKLELSYTGLEDDYKEIFLDVACMLKGREKDTAIRALESCGFHAKNGIKVLEQKSLITISKLGYLGMHDHIEEMGKNIVRRLHPNKPHKHSRLWIPQEIDDILASDLGSEATRCIRLCNMELDPATLMKGLVNMKKLILLEVSSYGEEFVSNGQEAEFDEVSPYLPNALRFLSWYGYPFTCLPKHFQGDNLVGLEMRNSSIIQLWEHKERKVLKKLTFIDLSNSNLRMLDLKLIPNLETLILQNCDDLVELDMHFGCQKLRFLNLSRCKLRVLDLGPTPNLEVLDLENCNDLVQLHMQGESPKLKSLNFSGSNLRGLNVGLPLKLQVLEFPNGSNSVKLHMDGESSKLKSLKFFLPGSIMGTLDFVRAPNLKTLSVSGSYDLEELESLFGSIVGLRFSRELTVANSFPDMAKNLHPLECLEELLLSCTQISHLPNSICMLKDLKFLSLKYCYLLERLPEDLNRLECLEMLYLRDCSRFRDLPNSICEMKHLKSISLCNCILAEKLPEELGRAEWLKTLDIRGTSIRHLPQSISQLEGLRIYGRP